MLLWLFPLVLAPVTYALASLVGVGPAAGTLLVMGVAIVPPLAFLVVSPRARLRPRGTVTAQIRTNLVAAAFIFALFSFLLAWTAHDNEAAPPGFWIGLLYLGVIFAGLGLWVVRGEVNA